MTYETPIRACAVIPTYNNPLTIRAAVQGVREHLDSVIVVDDGSVGDGRVACAAIASEGLAVVVHRPENGGKGAAVSTGLDLAREHGYTHALQIDADGQHDLDAIPRFLDAAAESPSALILGYPIYDQSVSKLRRFMRGFTRFWVNLEVGTRGLVRDAMIGFRVYPLQPMTQVSVRGARMDFDVEIAVRSAWSEIPIVNLPVKVRYLDESEGGVSHFQHVRDNLRFAWLHTRLCTEKSFRFFLRPFRWVLRRLGPAAGE